MWGSYCQPLHHNHHICTHADDEEQRAETAKAKRAKELAVKQEQLKILRNEQQKKRRDLRSLIYQDCTAIVAPKFANVKKREDRRFTSLTKKIKSLEHAIEGYVELEQQIEDLRNDVTERFEQQQVSISRVSVSTLA